MISYKSRKSTYSIKPKKSLSLRKIKQQMPIPTLEQEDIPDDERILRKDKEKEIQNLANLK